MNYSQMYDIIKETIEKFHEENQTQCVESVEVRWQPINKLGQRGFIIEELSFNITGRPLHG
jgi:hypothetical protein